MKFWVQSGVPGAPSTAPPQVGGAVATELAGVTELALETAPKMPLPKGCTPAPDSKPRSAVTEKAARWKNLPGLL